MATGLLLVSHSAALARATAELVRQMTGDRLALAIAAGAGPDHAELGTDPLAILAACEELAGCEGIVVLMDLGSAVLSAEMARDLADDALRARLHLAPAPFVEGALAAGVAAAAGQAADRVAAEALAGLAPKQDALGTQEHAAPPPPAATLTRAVTLADPNGLHLRPAARCVEAAARFDATLRLRHNGRVAPLDSPTALMALGAKGGTEVTIEASGPEAEPAAAALAAILAERPAEPHAETPSKASSGGFVPMSPGRAAGPVVAVGRARPAVPETTVADRAAALARLDEALAAARAALAGNPILAAQAALLADPALIGPARAAIEADGRHEAAAWRDAIAAAAASHEALDDPYLRARARDLREAGDAVLRELLGGFGLDLPAKPAIIAVDELTAAEAASLPPTILGVLDRRGGPTSHAAILLRAAGIPALGGVALDPPPSRAAFDGATGEFVAEPDAATEARFRAADLLAPGPASVILPGGEALEFWANVAGPADAAAAARAGAFGVGLARTEMLFLGRADMPGEDEQEARVGAMIAPFRGRPVVVRLLDAGADKPVPFLALASEENPALGVRGVRALLRRPDFCAAHLRALLRAGAGHDLRIMVPMVTFAAELRAIRDLLAAAARDVGCEPPPLGAMIEVPAAALTVPDLLAASDFFSIGTNDLTQYVLAADRGHKDLPGFADAGHPAVIGLCARVCRDAGAVPVSVCGEAAGDPSTARLLVEAGIRKLSMGAARLSALRAAFSASAS